MAAPIAFISFAREDLAVAEQLAEALERLGLSVTRTDRVIAPGGSWAAPVQAQIKKSSLVFIIVSRASVNNEIVASETALALAESQNGRPLVIPVIAESGAELPYFLRQRQPIDFTDRNSETALRALDSLVQYASSSERDSGVADSNAEAQLEILRTSRRSLDVEKAMFTERHAARSSAITASIGVLTSVLTLLAGVLTLSEFTSFLRSNLQFILGVLFGVVSSALAFWLLTGRRPGSPHEDRE